MTEKYDTVVRIAMPGTQKEQDYHLFVEADDPTDAVIKGIDMWKKAVEPSDVRVRKITQHEQKKAVQ